jgi:hypothetical protein
VRSSSGKSAIQVPDHPHQMQRKHTYRICGFLCTTTLPFCDALSAFPCYQSISPAPIDLQIQQSRLILLVPDGECGCARKPAYAVLRGSIHCCQDVMATPRPRRLTRPIPIDEHVTVLSICAFPSCVEYMLGYRCSFVVPAAKEKAPLST